ncbi:MAG: ATP-binding cassette domain-containing protein, partial [Methylococcales bacterium]
NQLTAQSSALTLLIYQLTVAASLIVSAWLFQQHNISAAVFVMLVFCVLAVFELVLPLSAAMQMLAKTQASAQRIRHIVEQKPLIAEPVNPQKIINTGAIRIKNLSFRYTEQSDWVLKNIQLDIPQGSKTAIIGESGAGKSTLLQLILRFYDAQQGSIEYSGIDYKKITSNNLMEQFAVLSQRTELFAATIKQNLLIAKPKASNSEIDQAIQQAGLDKFIKQLPEGLNTWIGEHGSKVSGGEARRIALARMYLKDAPILLLDEPTEGLDQATENDVLATLEQIAKHKTLVMVTHRKAGLKLVDRVFKLGQGQLFRI